MLAQFAERLDSGATSLIAAHTSQSAWDRVVVPSGGRIRLAFEKIE